MSGDDSRPSVWVEIKEFWWLNRYFPFYNESDVSGLSVGFDKTMCGQLRKVSSYQGGTMFQLAEASVDVHWKGEMRSGTIWLSHPLWFVLADANTVMEMLMLPQLTKERNRRLEMATFQRQECWWQANSSFFHKNGLFTAQEWMQLTLPFVVDVSVTFSVHVLRLSNSEQLYNGWSARNVVCISSPTSSDRSERRVLYCSYSSSLWCGIFQERR